MDRLQIIGAPQSPLVWAVRMAAVEKGLDAEFVGGRPHTPEILAIQPFGKIPVMRHGDFTLGESRAIALYLDAQSDDAKLVPRDPRAAARVEEWIMHFHTEFVPVMLLRYIVPYFFPAGPGGAPDRTVIDAALPALEKLIGILDRQLDGRDFIAGDYSLADIFFAPTLHYANALPEAARMIAAHPRVAAWLA
ncbi:MAG: glutathione S-transferase family protein, partial [Xanthobacteraceae bacterium]|nr:glutathione S-transferase family protein [Xanthobacteraceae bacterium]